MTTTMVRPAVERGACGGRGAAGSSRRAGFTLTELLVASVLGSLVLAGVLTAFLFFCRTGVRMGHYAEMERQSRVVLQRFGQDAREAKAVAWVNANTLKLTHDGGEVTYVYDSARRRLTRTPAGGSESELVSGIADFRFRAYDAAGAALTLTAANASQNTKMVQIDIDLARNPVAAASTGAQAVSARYVLRNKGTG
jgi:prepilin-type N-terminal cleavage/methylation domain